MSIVIAAVVTGGFLLINTWLTWRIHRMSVAAEEHHRLNGVSRKPREDEQVK